MHKVRTLSRCEAIERIDFAFLNAVQARPRDGSKSAKEAVRVALPDVSSLAVMGEADALGMARRLYINEAGVMKWVDGRMSRMPRLQVELKK